MILCVSTPLCISSWVSGRIHDLFKKIADLGKGNTIVMDLVDKLLSPEFQEVLEAEFPKCAPKRQIMLFLPLFL